MVIEPNYRHTDGMRLSKTEVIKYTAKIVREAKCCQKSNNIADRSLKVALFSSRLLGFRHVPPVVGVRLKLMPNLYELLNEEFQETFFQSPGKYASNHFV
jgi:hypothetical protein